MGMAGVHAEGAGFVGGATDDAARPRAADDDGYALERWVEGPLDRREEGVQIDVEDGATGRGTGSLGVNHGRRSGW